MLNRIKNVHIESHFSDFSETHKILLNYVRTTYKRNMVCDFEDKLNSTSIFCILGGFGSLWYFVSPVRLVCLWQRRKAPTGTAFGSRGERQACKRAEKNPWTHRNNSSPTQRTVWVPKELAFWWPQVHVEQRLGLTLSLNAVFRR